MSPLADVPRTAPIDPYTPMVTYSHRMELELRLNLGRNWLLETYLALGPAALESPATQDEDDPSLWWTPKDHFAHSARNISHSIS